MLIGWSSGLTHYSHNQLYGEWRVVASSRLAALVAAREASVRVVVETASQAAVLLSATEVELLTPRELATQPYLVRLGPDVLDRSTSVGLVRARLSDPAFARRSLAALLLDQGFLAGLGNYLRSDILHASGLRHTRRPVDLDAAALDELARAILALPRQSLRTGGTTNDLSLARALAARGLSREQRRFRVYGREGRPCWTCGTTILRVNVAGRGIYYCPVCQAA
jgi:endonuclease-8